MCGKIPYETKSDAVRDAKLVHMAYRNSASLRAKGGAKAGRKLRPYECPRCGKWHLTSRRKFKGKKV